MESARAETADSVRNAYEQLEIDANTIAGSDMVNALQSANRLDTAKTILTTMLARLDAAIAIDPNNAKIMELRIRALNRLAEVHQSNRNPSLGDAAESERIRIQARTSLDEAIAAHPNNGALRAFDTILSLHRASTIPIEERRELLEHATEQIKIGETIDGEYINDQPLIAKIANEFGDIERSQNNHEAAMEMFQRAHGIYTLLRKADPDTPKRTRDLAITETKIGELLVTQNQLEEARKHLERSLALREILAENESRIDAQRVRRDLARGHKGMSDVLYHMNLKELSRHHLNRYLDLTFEVAWLDPLDSRGGVKDVIEALTQTQRLVRLANGDTTELIARNLDFRDRIIEPRLRTLGDVDSRRLAIRADRNIAGMQLNDAFTANADNDLARSREHASKAYKRLLATIEIGAPILNGQNREAGLIAEIGLCNLYLAVTQRLLGENAQADRTEVEADRLYRLSLELNPVNPMVLKLGRQIDASSELVRDGT